MPVVFAIFPRRGIVVARFSGHVRLEECLSSAEAYSRHPDFRPGQNQLVDFSGVTSYERDVVRMLQMMARLPDHLITPGYEPLLVHLAPDGVGREMADFTRRSLSGIDALPFRHVTTEAEALDILGQPERSLDALFRAEAGT